MSFRSIYSVPDIAMREVLLKALSVFFLRILGAAVQFAFMVLLARFYGTEGIGAYALSLSVVLVASAVSRWGLDQAALKNIAVYAETNAWGKVKSVFLTAVVLIFLLSLLITLLLFPLAQWVAESLFSQLEIADLVKIMALSIVPFSLLNLAAEGVRALKRVVVSTAIQVVLVPLLATGGLLVFQTVEAKVIGAAYAYVLACFIVAVFSLLYWQMSVKGGNVYPMTIADVSRNLFRMANPMAWVTIIGIFMSFSETLLLGVFRSANEVGIYTAALRVTLLLNFVLLAFNSILAPKFASLYHQNKKEEIEYLASRSVEIMLLLTSPLFILCFLFPEQILKAFGSDFVAGSRCLMILASGQLINVMTGPIGILLMMTGHEKLLRQNTMTSSGIGFTAGVLLIPEFGVSGAAASAFIGGVTLQCLCAWSVKKNLGIGIIHGIRSRMSHGDG